MSKAQAWKAFSTYIRLRDSDENGYCRCISCGQRGYWYNDGIQAGHLIPGRTNSILFDPEITYAQCSGCNLNSGEQQRYWQSLKKRHNYTDEKFEEFRQRKNKTKKYTPSDYKEIKEKYTKMANDLMVKKRLA